MPSTYTVGEITSLIKLMMKMDIAELGENDSTQNDYIWKYMTLAMWRYVSDAFISRVSEPLTVTDDGYVTFKRSGGDIDDLYEQLRILDATGTEISPRTSFTAPKGWYRESTNTPIHMKGAGAYTMHYKAYPAKVTAADQVLEWPATSYDLLMHQTCGMILESKEFFEEANHHFSIADKLVPILIRANKDARGR